MAAPAGVYNTPSSVPSSRQSVAILSCASLKVIFRSQTGEAIL
jgi:hypothetical protein